MLAGAVVQPGAPGGLATPDHALGSQRLSGPAELQRMLVGMVMQAGAA